MAKTELPEGIAPDNNSRSSMSDGEFRAPDMATPGFSVTSTKYPYDEADQAGPTTWPGEGWPKARPYGPKKCQQQDRCDFDGCWRRPIGWKEEKDHGKGNGRDYLAIVIALAALFAVLGAIVIVNNQSTLPLCSSQPDWNQYNCRAG